jgi:hypothetical protein
MKIPVNIPAEIASEAKTVRQTVENPRYMEKDIAHVYV